MAFAIQVADWLKLSLQLPSFAFLGYASASREDLSVERETGQSASWEKPTISAVIPAYNSAGTIASAIESVLAQTVEIDEIIVVDDGSSDNTAEIASQFPRTQVIKQSNAGPAAARNTGTRAAKGEWIAFLDADDVWIPRKTEVQLKYIASDAGVIHCNEFDPINFGNLWHRQSHVSPSGALVRKKALIDVGGSEEARAIMGAEDLNLWQRIALLDWRFVKAGTGLFRSQETDQHLSGNEVLVANAELANIDAIGARSNCDPIEMDRLKHAIRIEYAKNLIAKRQWEDAARFLRDGSRGLASRWLSLAVFLRVNRLARTKLVRWLHGLDSETGSHCCAGTCNLPAELRRSCMESSKKPYFRPF